MKIIRPKNFAAKKAHYEPGIVYEDTLYISGQLSVNPSNGKIPKSLKDQTKQALQNLLDVLNEAGAKKEDVLMCRVYTPDISNWDIIDKEYADFFGSHKPARVVVPTNPLHFGCLIEIEAIAKLKKGNL